MYPVVLIISTEEKKSLNIVNNIIKSNGGEKSLQNFSAGSHNYPMYLYEIKTKYFHNTVALLPFEGAIQDVPTEVLRLTEVLIVYFDAQNKSFLNELTQLCTTIESNNIELGLLVTESLYDDCALGLTYENVKSRCSVTFDIVELCGNVQEKKNSSEDKGGHQCYDEIVEALHNFVWSNIDKQKSNICQDTVADTEVNIEAEHQVDAFEILLNNIQKFKAVSSTLDRNGMLDQAEELAKIFDDIMNED